ncbi:hypothetical protein [Falsiroseomonas sp. HW251]|uniref:hypothetical protein n=1 Tax=Falsiroseomonas sp. HW251 TaxID=3390998 RepID=UPI003D319A57
MIRDASLSTTPPPEAVRPVAQTAAPAAEAPPKEVAPPVPNPRLRLDPLLNIVVVEFRDSEGGLHSLPTAREMQAYRTGQAEPPGTTPRLDVTR